MACDEYHVPAHVQEHIDYVTPGIRLRHGSGNSKRNVEKRGKAGLKDGKPIHRTKPNYDIGPSYPGTNSTSCSSFITADCIQGALPGRPPFMLFFAAH